MPDSIDTPPAGPPWNAIAEVVNPEDGRHVAWIVRDEPPSIVRVQQGWNAIGLPDDGWVQVNTDRFPVGSLVSVHRLVMDG